MLKNKYFKVILSTMLVVTMLVCSNIVAFAADTTSSARSVDSMLLKSQQWLNENFSSNSSFGSVPEDGTSRRATVNGCIRALQIRLGIVNTADNFGQGTESLFKSTYKNGIVQQEYPSTEEDKVYGIIQCALWTKGYSTGSSSITKHFYDGTGNAVKALKRDLGISSDSSTVTLNVMKFLLSMKQSKKVSGGIDDIRTIQQRLNNRYEPYIGFIPTDGSMTRETSKALIIALQITEDIDPSLATGNFGKTTKERLPVLPDTINSLSSEKKNEFVDLIRYSLCANGIQVSLDTSEWNTEVSDAIGEFQQLMELPYNKKADVNTWMSLFLSSGNPDRSSVASDTRFEMTSARIEYLKENGISIVGRYLTGDSKSLRPGEAQRLLNAGIRFFPIFQETYYSDDVTKYNYNLGVSDARKAISKARQYGIPAGNIIYFAIDFDPTQDQIDTYVVPYFQAIKENIGEYCVGVYGTRNVCWNLINIAKASFVSDMSTGYSGNKGFKMPRNWNFDQFSEIKGIGTTKWDLDKTAYSGLYPPVTSLNSGTLNLSSTFSFNDGHVGDTRHLWGNYLTLKFTATDPNPNSEPGTGSTGSIIQVQLSYEKDGELIIGPVIEVEVDGNSVTLDKYLLGGMDRKDLTLSYVNTNRNNAQVNMKVDFYNWYEAS
jgi:peptidoglycan hydrolase-like protein with peptidoglycan-binding domain